MKLRFQADFDHTEYKKRNVVTSDCLFIAKCRRDEYPRVMTELRKLRDKNIERELAGKEPIDFDVTVNIHYRKRSLDANALMWALYTLMAEAMTRENPTRNPFTAQELYDEDMKQFAPRHYLSCDPASLSFFVMVLEQERGHVKAIHDSEQTGNKVIEIWQTSSYWDTKQMSDHIERLLNTLDDMGISSHTNGDLKKVFDDFEKWRSSNDGNGQDGIPDISREDE